MDRNRNHISFGEQENRLVSQIIKQALIEDIGPGDITSESIIPAEKPVTGSVIAKEEGIAAGIGVMRMTFISVDGNIRFEQFVKDGESVKRGDVLAKLKGPGKSILTAERTALNFLQRMSGIATLTDLFVRKTAGTGAKILDTRKTAPGLRIIDKWAVRLGGGENHRMGLFDMALIKENHITIAGSVGTAVNMVKKKYPGVPIEIEVKNQAELAEAVEYSPDRVLLDNMDTAAMKKAVEFVNGRIPLEASGNITLDNVAEVAATGVDYISVGALTHSVRALDISLIIETE